MVACNRCPNTPGEKAVSAQRTQVGNLLQDMAKLQETVNRLCSVRGAETEMDMWPQNHTPTMDTTGCETPWTLMTQNAGLQFNLHPPTSRPKTHMML